jgi:hypothetical protein
VNLGRVLSRIDRVVVSGLDSEETLVPGLAPPYLDKRGGSSGRIIADWLAMTGTGKYRAIFIYLDTVAESNSAWPSLAGQRRMMPKDGQKLSHISQDEWPESSSSDPCFMEC